MMEPQVQELLAEIQNFGRDYDAAEENPDRRMRNLKPETAQLLALLVKSSRRTRILEIGTSSGYSTIWLAWCARLLGGHVTSIDHSAEKIRLATSNLQRAGLEGYVHLVCGDATDTARGLDGPFDLVFFDSVQVKPHLQLEWVLPKLCADAMILADNALSHPDGMAPFLALLGQQEDFACTVIPVGKGLCFAHRLSASTTHSPLC